MFLTYPGNPDPAQPPLPPVGPRRPDGKPYPIP